VNDEGWADADGNGDRFVAESPAYRAVVEMKNGGDSNYVVDM
jgi:hypothetical protein